MDIFELYNISERYIELVNPSTPEKISKLGWALDLKEGDRIIDFGCGYAEPLIILSKEFGITGVGVDIRKHVCSKAKEKVKKEGLNEHIGIVCEDAAKYPFDRGHYDVAMCIGASFIWGGFRPTIRAMKSAIDQEGKLVIGEPYRKKEDIPKEYRDKEEVAHLEHELLEIAHEEGFEFQYIVRASTDDWDTYETSNWKGFIKWLQENPDHPERQQVVDRLHVVQQEYLRYGKDFVGWAMYVLVPKI